MSDLTREQIEALESLLEQWRYDIPHKYSEALRAVIPILRSLEAPSAIRDTAWLVESVGGRWGTGYFLSGVGEYDTWGTIEVAVRFSRKEDAERVIASLVARDGRAGRTISGNGPQYEACEHEWVAATPPAERAAAGSVTVPREVYYNAEHDNFYSSADGKGMGTLFWGEWKSRCSEFPTSAAPQSAPPEVEATNWQPIETAPKDGRKIVLGRVGIDPVLIAHWETEPSWAWKGESPCWAVYMADDDFYSHYLNADWATHWQPLPAPPL